MEMLGGETTAVSSGSNAFELSARNLSNEARRTFEVGDSFFNQNWVIAPRFHDCTRRPRPNVQRALVFLLPQPRRPGKTAGERPRP